MNTYLIKNDCKYSSSNLDIKKIPDGLRLKLISKGTSLKSSRLLIDFINEDDETLLFKYIIDNEEDDEILDNID